MGEREIRECYSLTLNGQYYLKKRISLAKDFRVFVGLGAGDFFSRHDNPLITITLPNGQQVDGNVIETTQGKGGFYPRIGFEYHHFSVIIDYNFIYRKFLRFAYFDPLLNQSLPGVYLYRSDNYLSFKIGYYFGGGKKKR